VQVGDHDVNVMVANNLGSAALNKILTDSSQYW
jgi:hypothetical protein